MEINTMTYEAQLFDGCADAGSTDISGDSLAQAVERAEKWARGGDWHTAGSVVLVICDTDGEELYRDDVLVDATCEAD